MFIWQYINPSINEILSIQQDYKNTLLDNSYFYQYVNIAKNTRFMGIIIEHAVLIQVPANTHCKIHKDHRYDGASNRLAIQIPLSNCEESSTNFWESSSDPVICQTSNGHPYAYYESSMCTKISEFKLTRPVIFNTDILHNVTNPTNKIRQAISLRFKDDPWHLVTQSR